MKRHLLFFFLLLFGMQSYSQSREINLNEGNTIGVEMPTLRSLSNDDSPKAVRKRAFTMNNALRSSRSVSVKDRLSLDLFNDKKYTALVEKIDTDINGTVSILGKIEGYPMGYCIISTSSSGNSFMTVDIPELQERYATQLNINTHQGYLLELDNSEKEPGCGSPSHSEEEDHHFIEEESDNLRSSVSTRAGVNDLATIDIMIVYTPAAKSYADKNNGGIQNAIKVLMDKSNLVLTNSKVNIKLNLVYSHQASYTETGDSNTDLERLAWTADQGDSYLNEVHSLRDTHKADLVMLLTTNTDVGGLAYRLSTELGSPNYGFSLVGIQYATTGYSPIHEIGHNMGLYHHRDQKISNPPTDSQLLYPYAAGWRWKGSDNKMYCSVMTYEGGGYFTDGLNAERVPNFSDPTTYHKGAAMGNAGRGDAVRTLKNIKHVIAAYKGACNLKPTNLSVGSVTESRASFSWTAISGAVSYTLQCKASTATQWLNYTVTNPSANIVVNPNTTYNWQVKANCTLGEGDYVKGANFTTLGSCATVPSGLAVSSIAANSARLAWNSVSGATSYTVEYKTSAASSWSAYNTTATYYTPSLVGGTTYNWRVKANCSSGSSAYTTGSNFTTTVAISAPSGLAVSSITVNSARLAWNAVSGATSYTVEYKTSAASAWTALAAVTTNYRDLTGLTANTVYNWRVKANFPTGSSASTTGSNFTTSVAITAPTGLSAGSITANSGRVQWTSISGATSYTVEYKTSAASAWTALAAVTTNYRDLTGLTANTVYNWRVKANFPTGSSTSTTGSNFTTSVAITAPTGLSAGSITANSGRVQWTSISGATSYTVEYKTSAASAWTALAAVTTNYRDLTGLTANTVYNWRVKANFPAGSSTSTVGTNFTTTVVVASCVNNYESNETIATAYSINLNTAYSAGIGVSGDKDYYKFTLTSASDVVVTLTNLPKDYELKLYNSSSSEIGSSTAGGVSSETITKAGLAAGTYYVQVYGYSSNFDVTQCYSLKVAASVAITAPTGLSAGSITANSGRVQWTSISGATSYTVEYKTSAASAWTALAAVTTNYRDLTGLTANTVYNWRVKANFPTGSSASTTGSNFTTSVAITAPTGLSAGSITANSGRVQWTSISGATSYTVEYKTSAASAWTALAAVTTNYRDLTGLTANTVYNWRVKANFPTGSSTSTTGSNFTTSVAITAPTGLSAGSITANSGRVQWTSISGATSYTVEYKTSAASAWTALAAVTTNYRDLTGLTANTVYNWRVKANFPAGSSTSTVGTNFTTTVVVASCVNNYESNETIATAYSINLNTAYSAGIGVSGDKDYYKFTLTSASDVVVTLTNLPKDYELKLYNSSSSEIGSSTAGGVSSETITKAGLAAGTYYVQVYGYSSNFDVTQCYSLKVAATVSIPSCINNYESNETIATAYSISTNVAYSAGIGSSTDKDYYKFTLSSTSDVVVTLTNLPKDYELKLYNSSSSEIGSSTAGGVSSETITKAGLSAGTYYVQVYGYSSNFDVTQCYSLKVAATVSIPSCINNYESNNTLATAYPINFYEFKTHQAGIGSSTDIDFYKFTINYAENVAIKLTNLPKDYELVLLNSAGTVVDSSRKGGTSSELIEKYLLPAGTYYVQVYGFSSAYDLSSCYSLHIGLIDCITLPGTNICIEASGDEISSDMIDAPTPVNLYPNPVSDVLNINTGVAGIKQVTISDLSGKVVLKATSNQISVQNLNRGMYIVTVETENGTTSHKINKQ